MNKKIIILIILSILVLTNIEGVLAIKTKNNLYEKDVNLKSDSSKGDGETKRYALVIGTDPMAFCTNDAEDMSSVLEDHGWNVKVYKGLSATKENILNGIQWLADQSDSDDIVLFFFSGHGATRVIADYYNKPIFLIELKLAFLKINPLTTQVLIFDTCHAGTLNVGADVPKFRLKYFYYDGEYPDGDEEFEKYGFFGFNGTGRVVLAACKGFQYSYGDPYLRNGVFTYYLVEALRNKETDTNKNGWISEKEAFDYAKPKTRQRTKDYSLLGQCPEIVKDTHLGQVSLIKVEKKGVNRNKSFSLIENHNFLNSKIYILLKNLLISLSKFSLV